MGKECSSGGPICVDEWPDEVFEKLRGVLLRDDKKGLIRLNKTREFAEVRDGFHMQLYEFDSLNCLIAVLNGEIKGLADGCSITGKNRLTALHMAAICGAPMITQFLLDRGYASDMDVRCDYDYMHLKHVTPLDIAIEVFDFNGTWFEWLPGQSIFELLLVLYRFRLRTSLQVAWLLAQNTPLYELRTTFLKYIKERKLVQVAVLCIVVPELANPGGLSNLGALAEHVVKDLLDIESRTAMEDGLILLLQLFNTIGHKLHVYFHLQLRPNVIFEVAHLLRLAALDMPKDCFPRFFEPVIFEAEEKKQIRSSKIVVPIEDTRIGMKLSILDFDLKRSNIQCDYINKVLPDLTPEDADRLLGAIEKVSSTSGFQARLRKAIEKVSSTSVCHARPEGMAEGVNVLKEDLPPSGFLRRLIYQLMAQLFHIYQAVLKPTHSTNFTRSMRRMPKMQGTEGLSQLLHIYPAVLKPTHSTNFTATASRVDDDTGSSLSYSSQRVHTSSKDYCP